MMMTAQEVYNAVEAYAPNAPQTACDLNKRCNPNRQCASPQTAPMADFDPVKTKWNSSHRQSSMSSVDGLAFNHDVLCFVEIKSTVNFTSFQIKLNKTDAENSATIQQQMAKYSSSLQKKFVDSFAICQGITGDSQFADGISIRYVLVTDIDLNPLANLATQWSQLATGSSNWDLVFASYLGATFNQVSANLSGVKTEYKSCQELDNFLRGL
jgi:hypothetical protein